MFKGSKDVSIILMNTRQVITVHKFGQENMICLDKTYDRSKFL